MSPILIAGTIVVNLALVSYTLGIVSERRTFRIARKALACLTIGVVLDVSATVCMIIGSTQSPFTLHGLLGYSSLTAMALETALAWRHRQRAGDRPVPTTLHRYSLIAYLWWVAAYITGAALVFLAR